MQMTKSLSIEQPVTRRLARVLAVLLLTCAPAAAGTPPPPPEQPAAQAPAQEQEKEKEQEQEEEKKEEQEEKPSPWWQRITFRGDLRGRYEGFFQEGRPDRNRERFRLRLNVRAALRDDLRLTIRLASGDPGDPTSTNQSFAEFFTRKPILIDQVALVFTPRAVPALTLGGGKFGHPVLRTQMVWDDDLNWEGTYQQVQTPRDRPVSLRIATLQSPVTEVGRGPDAYIFGEQVVATIRRGPHEFDIAVASYGFREVDQIAIGFVEGVLQTKNTNGLRLSPDGAVLGYASRFHLVDVIGQATFDVGGKPVILLADWVTNTRAGDEGTGIWLTAGYGEADARGTWSAAYTYARLEREAALAVFMFSDLPGTNIRAHIPEISYALARRVFLDFTGLFSKQLEVAPGAANPLLKRIQIDLRVSF